MVKQNIKSNFSASLVLPKIIANTIGFNNAIDIIDTLKDTTGFDYEFSSDKSNFMEVILKHFNASNLKNPFNDFVYEKDLKKYDLNIKDYLDQINQKRDITWKVFQYVALLFTEIYLDKYFQAKKNKDIDEFIGFLNNALKTITKNEEVNEYTKEDLEKLCFWMATGSGKTLIMHINYLQYMHYIKRYDQEINNIILITPNEDLSNQHKKELDKSKINSTITSKENYSAKTDVIKIIDINKLSEQSKVKTIDYRAFGEKNLIFVDEGHRGSSGNIWMHYRNQIAKEGFTFEYSATFQDIKQYKNNSDDPVSDYKKTILFDYSYKYYHKHGYGKDYFIANVESTDNRENERLMMLGNLLSFYEQKKLFLQTKEESEKQHQIENPLWLLVGSKVVEQKSAINNEIKADITKFVHFLNYLKVEKSQTLKDIENILKYNTTLKNKDTNEDFFQDQLNYLRQLFENEFESDYNALLQDIFKIVFYSDLNDSMLVLEDIKDSDGEIGLRYGNSPYFGLIYVGVGNDKKIIDSSKNIGCLTNSQTIKSSLFSSLNKDEEKPLNILVGAKKFIEGWDNYRISSMLLMNFAKNKGVSAIQLFGRGIRLHGYGNCMKRSSHSLPPIKSDLLKENIHLLETLNVYGIDAKYMEAFREELKEDIDFYVEKQINIEKNPHGLLNYGLKCIQKEKDTEESFKNSKIVDFNMDYSINLSINKHITTLKSKNKNSVKIDSTLDSKEIINDKFFTIVDWEYILSELRRFKRIRGFRNLSLPEPRFLKELLLNGIQNIKLEGDESFLATETYQELKNRVEGVYLELFKNIINKNYSINYKKHYDKKLQLVTLDQNMLPDKYTIKIYVDDKGNPLENKNDKKLLRKMLDENEEILDMRDLASKIESSLSDISKILIKFDKHVYYPLLLASEENSYNLYPAGLNKGEKDFVEDLKKFVENKNLKNNKILLLRNHENTGFGYYLETENYFPDFVMWVINDKEQKIMFIDPKGLVHPDMEKVNFNKRIKEIEEQIKSEYEEDNIELYSFLITETEKQQIPEQKIRETPEDHGVYFFNDNYLSKIFSRIGINFSNQ